MDSDGGSHVLSREDVARIDDIIRKELKATARAYDILRSVPGVGFKDIPRMSVTEMRRCLKRGRQRLQCNRPHAPLALCERILGPLTLGEFGHWLQLLYHLRRFVKGLVKSSNIPPQLQPAIVDEAQRRIMLHLEEPSESSLWCMEYAHAHFADEGAPDRFCTAVEVAAGDDDGDEHGRGHSAERRESARKTGGADDMLREGSPPQWQDHDGIGGTLHGRGREESAVDVSPDPSAHNAFHLEAASVHCTAGPAFEAPGAAGLTATLNASARSSHMESIWKLGMHGGGTRHRERSVSSDSQSFRGASHRNQKQRKAGPDEQERDTERRARHADRRGRHGHRRSSSRERRRERRRHHHRYNRDRDRGGTIGHRVRREEQGRTREERRTKSGRRRSRSRGSGRSSSSRTSGVRSSRGPSRRSRSSRRSRDRSSSRRRQRHRSRHGRSPARRSTNASGAVLDLHSRSLNKHASQPHSHDGGEGKGEESHDLGTCVAPSVDGGQTGIAGGARCAVERSDVRRGEEPLGTQERRDLGAAQLDAARDGSAAEDTAPAPPAFPAAPVLRRSRRRQAALSTRSDDARDGKGVAVCAPASTGARPRVKRARASALAPDCAAADDDDEPVSRRLRSRNKL